MTKIALVVGHNARSQGGVRATDGRTEYDWMGGLAAQILSCAPGNYRVFRRPTGLGYGTEIRTAYTAVDAWGADISLERLANLIQPAKRHFVPGVGGLN